MSASFRPNNWIPSSLQAECVGCACFFFVSARAHMATLTLDNKTVIIVTKTALVKRISLIVRLIGAIPTKIPCIFVDHLHNSLMLFFMPSRMAYDALFVVDFSAAVLYFLSILPARSLMSLCRATHLHSARCWICANVSTWQPSLAMNWLQKSDQWQIFVAFIF